MPKAKPEDSISKEVADIFELENTLEATEQELMANEQFRNFLTMQKEFKEKIDTAWRDIEKQMIDNDVKSIKGDWGSLTIAERLNWEYDPSMLAPKFFKKIVDTKKLSDTFRLEGKPPKAATPKFIKYLVKRIK